MNDAITTDSLMESEYPAIRQLGSSVAEINTMLERGSITKEEHADLARDIMDLTQIDRDAMAIKELVEFDEAVAALKILLKLA